QLATGGPVDNPPRNGQVPIKPGVEQRPAVDLHPQPTIAPPRQLRPGLDHQAGAVGMSTRQAHALGHRILPPLDEGNDGTAVAGGKVTTASLELPCVTVAKVLETGGDKGAGHFRNRVEGGGGSPQRLKRSYVEGCLVGKLGLEGHKGNPAFSISGNRPTGCRHPGAHGQISPNLCSPPAAGGSYHPQAYH